MRRPGLGRERGGKGTSVTASREDVRGISLGVREEQSKQCSEPLQKSWQLAGPHSELSGGIDLGLAAVG